LAEPTIKIEYVGEPGDRDNPPAALRQPISHLPEDLAG
ncbi:unnamed protein product, partial [marine sediment metagenome]